MSLISGIESLLNTLVARIWESDAIPFGHSPLHKMRFDKNRALFLYIFIASTSIYTYLGSWQKLVHLLYLNSFFFEIPLVRTRNFQLFQRGRRKNKIEVSSSFLHHRVSVSFSCSKVTYKNTYLPFKNGTLILFFLSSLRRSPSLSHFLFFHKSNEVVQCIFLVR